MKDLMKELKYHVPTWGDGKLVTLKVCDLETILSNYKELLQTNIDQAKEIKSLKEKVKV